MIRKGTFKDIDRIIKITKACASFMITNQIYQWNEHYPSKSALENDALRNELYVLEINEILIGCIVISTCMDEEYIPISWLTENENNIYIHRLAVHPNKQGNGLAQNLMSFAEQYARDNNFVSVRLDTFSQNPRNLKFYPKRGYKKTGEIYFDRIKEYPFYCFELVF